MAVALSRRYAASGFWILFCCLLAGCFDRSNSNWTSTDQGKVNVLVTSIGGFAEDPKLLQDRLTGDVKLDDKQRDQLVKSSYRIEGPIRFEAETAIVPIYISDPEGKNPRKVEWTAVKVGEEWKFKSLPLQ